ncbi:MAG TPA: homoserine O-succinyltransferase [Clostridiales bacterium]|jgi:homoserine O-succinyltransferase|nr:homoserine O-succinyltransferase [Clostridiales bacterium]
MPIKIPSGLPARQTLEEENIFVMDEYRALHQDIRPLRIAILNLMPTKIATETQLIRLLSNTSLQLELTLLGTASHKSRNTSPEHMATFYKNFYDVREEKFDGLIITGAPVEEMPYEDVDYWPELCEIMHWSETNVFSVFYICWAAQAAMYYHYGVPKVQMASKVFGVFSHKVELPRHPLVRGFDEKFYAPHSRHTEVLREDIEKVDALKIVASSSTAGPYIIADDEKRRFFVTGHSEYDSDTLAREYFRDRDKGLDIDLPYNYFPGGDTAASPRNIWRSHAHLLYSNWLNHFVYQLTPYDINKI